MFNVGEIVAYRQGKRWYQGRVVVHYPVSNSYNIKPFDRVETVTKKHTDVEAI